MEHCPCGNTTVYEQCCKPSHAKELPAPTAEALMRSRYCAYVKGEIEYLFKTILPEKRTALDFKSAKEWSEKAEWLGLEILSSKGGEGDQAGQVEFIARYKASGVEQEHHEVSRFKKRGSNWYFVEGKLIPAKTDAAMNVSRSAPCPCGSGKKFKRCCG